MKVLDKMKLNNAEIREVLRCRPVMTGNAYDKSPLSSTETGYSGVSIDSRTIMKDNLFFALRGEKYDGHDYIKQAIANGASGIVIDRSIASEETVAYKVDDTLQALGDLAAYYRRKFDIECVAITGSNGKTTTKEMLAVLLQTKFRTLKTTGNFNNLIGLPLSVFNLDDTYQVAVFELGMSIPGEMSRLAEISQPRVGVFTNIAPVHLETMGSVGAIARGKYELVEKLPPEGAIVLNIDDNFLPDWIEIVSQKTITYGLDNKADFKVSEFRFSTGGQSIFKVKGIEYRLNLPGRHNIYNAVAAIATAVYLGCKPEDLVEPLRRLQPYQLRSEVFECKGVVFINDCYNANPVSMENAIDVLADYPSWGRKIAVLGDMLELGHNEKGFHMEIGWYTGLKNIDALFTFGELSQYYLTKYQAGAKEHFDNKTELIQRLKQYLRAGDVVLVKGSRGMAMEEITKAFRGQS